MTSATRSAARVLNAVTLHSRPRKASHNTTARRSVQMFFVFSCVNTYQNMLCQPSEHKEFDRGSEEDRVVELDHSVQEHVHFQLMLCGQLETPVIVYNRFGADSMWSNSEWFCM